MNFRERTMKFLSGASKFVSHPISALEFGALKIKRNLTKATWGLRYAMSKDSENMIDTSILDPINMEEEIEEKETRILDSNVGVFNYLADYTVNTSLDIEDIRMLENKINRAIEYNNENDMLIKAFLVDNMDKTAIEKEDILIQFLSRISKDIPKVEEVEDIENIEEEEEIIDSEKDIEKYIEENEIENSEEISEAKEIIYEEPNFILVDSKENIEEIKEEEKEEIIEPKVEEVVKDQNYFESIFGGVVEAEEIKEISKSEEKEEIIEPRVEEVQEEIQLEPKEEKEEVVKKVTLADKLEEVNNKLALLQIKLAKKTKKTTKYLVELASTEVVMTSEKLDKISKNILKEKELKLELDTLLLKKNCIEKLINKKEVEEQERKNRKKQEEQDIIDFSYGFNYDDEKAKEEQERLNKVQYYENFFAEQEKQNKDAEYINFWENTDVNKVNPINKLSDKEIKTYLKLEKKMGLR